MQHPGMRTGVLAIAAAAGLAGTAGAIEPTVVMKTGTQAPGTPGVFEQVFGPPAIDAAGDVVFGALLAEGPGVTNDSRTGIWATEMGMLGLAARAGSQAPGTDGAVFEFFGGEPVLVTRRGGRVGFVATLVPGVGDATSANDWGVWAGPPGALDLVVREGDPAPGIPGAIVDELQTPYLGADGSVAISGGLELGPGGVVGATSRVIWVGMPGALQPAARTGDPAPGTPSTFDFLNIQGYGGIDSLALAGEIAFTNGVTFTEDAGGWVGGPGSLELVGRESDPSPILGATYRNFGTLSINRGGVTAFAQYLNSDAPGIDFTNNHALWLGSDGFYELIAQRGDGAAAMDGAQSHGDVRIEDVYSEFITRDDQVVYRAGLFGDDVTSDDNRALFQTYRVGGPRLTRMIARTGVAIPRTDRGQGPAEIERFLEDPIVNARSDVVFKAELRTGVGGVTEGSNEGIFARISQREGIFPVVVEGQAIDLDPDPAIEDLRTVADFIPFVRGTGGDDGQPTQLNDRGELALSVPFADGSWAVLLYNLSDFPCNAADVADPRGQLDLADVDAFVVAFTSAAPPADLNADGLYDLLDIAVFVSAFTDGCPF